MKTLLFDFDGTLADSYDMLISCINVLSVKYTYPIITDLKILKNTSMKQVIKEDLGIRLYKLPFFMKDVQKEINVKAHEIQLFPGRLPVLKKLAKQFSLSILSSNSKEVIT